MSIGAPVAGTWAENSKRADRAIAEVRRVYADGMKAVTGIWQNSTEKATEANMQKLGPVIDKWAGQHRMWAEQNGRLINNAWSVYTWDRWLQEGREHASAVKTHTSASFDAGFFTGVVKPTVTASVADGKQLAGDVAATVTKWGPWALGAVALLAIAVIATNARSVVRAVA